MNSDDSQPEQEELGVWRTEFSSEIRNVFVSMLNVAMMAVEVNHNTEHDEFGALPKAFLYKQCLHAYTAWSIVQPALRSELVVLVDGAVMLDIPSLAHVARAMFELDVTMKYLFLDASTPDERAFRIEMWILHGICRQREAFHERLAATGDSDNLVAPIRSKIEEIRNLPYYKALVDKSSVDKKLVNDAKEYRHYFSKNERITSIAKRFGYDAIMVDSLYIHTSAYTHTNAYSIFQLLRAPTSEQKMSMCDDLLEYACISLKQTIRTFIELDMKFGDDPVE